MDQNALYESEKKQVTKRLPAQLLILVDVLINMQQVTVKLIVVIFHYL